MNPTGNFHVPVKYFLGSNGFLGLVQMVDARNTVYLRKVMNLGTEKSDREDVHVLTATPWLDRKSMESHGHERNPLSEITRERDTSSRTLQGSRTASSGIWQRYSMSSPMSWHWI